MAFDFLLDQKTNDLKIENNEIGFTTENQVEVTQRLGIKLRTFREEWFLDQTYGIPYLQQLISKVRNKNDADIIFINAIREEPDVSSIKDYVSTWDRYNRKYEFTANITTPAGVIPVTILTTPAEEFIYPDNGDANSRVECGITDLPYFANRLYKFINIEGLPENTYATWINGWD